MGASLSFDVDPHESLGLVTQPRSARAAFDGLTCLGFEFTSRGDRVPGRLLLPASNGDRAATPAPVILLQHGIGGSTEAEYMDACAPWVRGGAAVASIDFPLHGTRESAKLSEHLLTSLDFAAAADASPVHADVKRLWLEFTRQAVIDLRRTLDALEQIESVDASRLVYGGFSLGAMIGTIFCAHDPRPRAAALALAGGGFGPEDVDPSRHIARIAPRPVLLLNARGDERIGTESAKSLRAAAGEPVEQLWFDSGHTDLPGIALKAMWTFLRDQLGLA